MVTGSPTRCAECGRPMMSCVMPAYCMEHDPAYKGLREHLASLPPDPEGEEPTTVVYIPKEEKSDE